MAESRERRYSPYQAGEAVDSFIDCCESSFPDLVPDDFTICRALGIRPATWAAWQAGESGGESVSTRTRRRAYADAAERLMLYRENWYARLAMTNPKLISFVNFALRQPKNGMCRSGETCSEPTQLEIVMSGVSDPGA